MSSLEQLVGYWKNVLSFMGQQQHGVFGPDAANYPTEPAMTLLSGYLATRGHESFATLSQDLKAKACDQLDYAKGLGDPQNGGFNGLLVNAGFLYPDNNGRQIYNFAIAAQVLLDSDAEPPAPDPADAQRAADYLNYARNCASTLLNLDRAWYTCRDRAARYLLAHKYKYDGSVCRPYVDPVQGIGTPGVDNWWWPRPQGGFVDPNQNAGLGLAFSLVNYDPAWQVPLWGDNDPRDPAAQGLPPSRHDPSWHQANAELHASFSIQTKDGKLHLTDDEDYRGHFTIPVNHYRPLMYAAYTHFLWVLADSYRKESDCSLERAIRNAAAWFSTPPRLNDLATSMTYYECWYRLLLFWRIDTNPEYRRKLAQKAIDQVLAEHPGGGGVGKDPGFATPFCYFRLLGVDEGEYLPPTE
jgi:hypothetical protein